MKDIDTTVNGNKLIAEFMGGKLKYYNLSNEPYYLMPNKQQWMPERLVYHTSWDWLMPVYLKIVQNELYGENEEAIILFNIMYERLGDGDRIKEVWKYIVQFIAWYNQNKN